MNIFHKVFSKEKVSFHDCFISTFLEGRNEQKNQQQ